MEEVQLVTCELNREQRSLAYRDVKQMAVFDNDPNSDEYFCRGVILNNKLKVIGSIVGIESSAALFQHLNGRVFGTGDKWLRIMDLDEPMSKNKFLEKHGEGPKNISPAIRGFLLPRSLPNRGGGASLGTL